MSDHESSYDQGLWINRLAKMGRGRPVTVSEIRHFNESDTWWNNSNLDWRILDLKFKRCFRTYRAALYHAAFHSYRIVVRCGGEFHSQTCRGPVSYVL